MFAFAAYLGRPEIYRRECFGWAVRLLPGVENGFSVIGEPRIVLPRALNEVSTALGAGFFRFPSLSLAFWEIVSTTQLHHSDRFFTVKSAAFSFCFLVLLGILFDGSLLQVLTARTLTLQDGHPSPEAGKRIYQKIRAMVDVLFSFNSRPATVVSLLPGASHLTSGKTESTKIDSKSRLSEFSELWRGFQVV